MALLVKDANTQVQSLGTQADSAANLVPESVPCLVVGGVATPLSPANPLPVINAAPAAASDGSGSITAGGTAQLLFGGVTPANGYLVCNNSAGLLYISDVGTATAGGTSIQIAAGATFITPNGYKPPGPVSIFGGSTAQAFAARRW